MGIPSAKRANLFSERLCANWSLPQLLLQLLLSQKADPPKRHYQTPPLSVRYLGFGSGF
jgi:hypothetical protein